MKKIVRIQPKPKRRYRLCDQKKLVEFAKWIFKIVLIIIIVESLWIMVGNLTVKTVVAKWGIIEKGGWVEALFLNDTELLRAPTEGSLSWKEVSGARIPGQALLAYVAKSKKISGESNLLTAIEWQLLERFRHLLQSQEIAREELNKVDQQIISLREKLAQKKLKKIRKKLFSLKKEKKEILRNIQDILKQLALVKADLGTNLLLSQTVVAARAGFFLSQYDGWEEILKPAAIHKLTVKDFQRRYQVKQVASKVEKEQIIGKIIDPFSGLIAVMVNPQEVLPVSRKDVWQVKVADHYYPGIITQKYLLAPDRLIVALKGVRLPDEWLMKRQTRIHLIYRVTQGVTIPVQAIYQVDGQAVVRLVKDVGYKTKRIGVIATDGAKAVVTGIESGTLLFSKLF